MAAERRLAPGDPRTEILRAPVTPREKWRVESHCARKGITVGTLIRNRLVDLLAADPLPASLPLPRARRRPRAR